MGKHLFLISLFLGLLIASSSICVSGEILRYIINENAESKNTSLWTGANTCTIQTCAFNSAYDSRPTNGLNITTCSSGDVNLKSFNFVFNPSYDYYFNTTLFPGRQGDNYEYVSFGLGGGGGYRNSYLKPYGGSNYALAYVSETGERDLVTFTQGLEYDVSIKYSSNYVYVYVNNTLKFSEPDTAIFGNNIFYVDSGGDGTCGFIADISVWFDNFNISEVNQGYVANFTVRDEIGYFPINNTLLYFYLYDSISNVLLQSKTSNSSMVQFNNLTYSPYYLIYHDSVYNSRTFRWTPSVPYENFTLFAINNSVASQVIINVKDSLTSSNIANAVVKVYKSINFTQTLIYDGYTDDAGNAVMWLNVTDVYNIIVSKTNYITTSKTINNIVMTGGQYLYTVSLSRNFGTNLSSITDYFTYSYSPTNNLLTNGTYQDFIFIVNSSQGAIDYFSVNTTIGGTDYGDYSTNAYGGLLNISTNPGISGVVFNVTYRIKVSGYTNPYTIIVSYYIYDSGQRAATSFDFAMRDLKSSFTKGERIVLVLLVALLLFMALSIISNGDVALYGALFIMGMFTYIGWFDGLIFVLIVVIVFAKIISYSQGRN